MSDATLEDLLDGSQAPAGDRAQKIEDVAKAAVVWVYGQSCSDALRELEFAVERLMGISVRDLDDALDEDLIG